MKNLIFSLLCICTCLPLAATLVNPNDYDEVFVNKTTEEFTGLVGQFVTRTGLVRFADAEIPPSPPLVDRGYGNSESDVFSLEIEGDDACQFSAWIKWRNYVSNECTVVLTYHPRSLGTHSATLWVYCTNAGVPTMKIPLRGEATGVLGDLNGDGQLTIGDVTGMINLLLTQNREFSEVSDINGDGQLSISDVTALINNLLTKE